MIKMIPAVPGILIALYLLGAAAEGQAQNPAVTGSAVIQGTICDSQSLPLPGASVSLQTSDHAHKFAAQADAQGHYRFQSVPPGQYTLNASLPAYSDNIIGPIVVGDGETKTLDLHLTKTQSASAATAKSGIQFSDTPQFQIAGVVDPTNYGGHGSDTGIRTKEALARDTELLTKDPPPKDAALAGSEGDLHRELGDLAEKEGRPLDAVREYQRAAESRPNELNFFAWGAELLLHRAYVPAIEVLAKGQHQFPDSVRMAVGLSIATYDHGDSERGERLLLNACDIDPQDPTPYLFMGRLQEGEKTVSPAWLERLRRFASLQPENPIAHYYYAVAANKQNSSKVDRSVVKAELEKSIQLDPKLGRAYLQLGILDEDKKEVPAAIAEFKKAIETMPLPDEAHYRLAQIYRQNGDSEKARKEIGLYQETSQQKAKQDQDQRHEIQQFVYTLREQKPDPPQNLKPQ